HGRKKTLVWSSLVMLIFSTTSSFVHNFVLFLILKFVTGVFFANAGLSTYTLLIEMMPTDQRALPETIKSLLILLGGLMLCVIAMVVQHWHYIQLTISLYSSYVVLLYWLIDDSLIWLCSVKKYKEAEVLVRKIARINKVDPEKALGLLQLKLWPNPKKCDELDTTDTKSLLHNPCEEKKESPVEMKLFLTNSRLLKLTVTAMYLWFAVALSTQGLVMTSTYLTNDFYLGYTLGTLMELPGTILFWYLINRIGRKRCLSIFPLMAAFLLICTSLLNAPFAGTSPGRDWLLIALPLIGRIAMSVTYQSSILYANELFPTCVRNTGCGMAYVAGSIGVLLSPYSRTLVRHVAWAPNVMFGALCISLPLAIRSLPETLGRELPQTLEDLEKKPQPLITVSTENLLIK
ncbi:solute carrier family 22 member 3, partial [Biomphalaria glabrata]